MIPFKCLFSLTEILKRAFIQRKRKQSIYDEESAQRDARLTDHNIHLHLEGRVKRNWSVYTQYVFGVDPSTNAMLNCSRYLYTLVARRCNEHVHVIMSVRCYLFSSPHSALETVNTFCDKADG